MNQILVIHAKHLKERLKHMERQLKDWPGKVDYILEADKDELTDEMLRNYIRSGSELDKKTAATSCSLKHLFSCKYIVEHQLEGALVLEDDIVLHKHFIEDFEKTMDEYQSKYSDEPIIISYEDSSLQFIPRSSRVKGQWLYNAPHGRVRFNGAQYINQKAAKVVWNEVMTNKCYIASDHYYVHLYGKGLIKYLWAEPSLATQGSFVGVFDSTQGQTKTLEGVLWRLKYAYKRLIYWFR